MKKDHPVSQQLLWLSMIVIICGVIVAVIITNITLRSIEKHLPSTLLTELNDLSFVLENLSEVVNAAKNAKNSPSADNLSLLRAKVETVFNDIVRLRETYVFDNLVQASAFHAVVAPAIADLQIWLSNGVSGFGPETGTTAAIAFSRIDVAYQKARSLNRESKIRAQKILEVQRKRIDRFLFSANLLFALTVLITFSVVYLLILQYKLQKRESAAQAELRKQRDLLNSLFENVLLGITVWDHEGVLLFSNRGFTEITGYSIADIKTLDDWFPKAYPDPIYRDQVLADWKSSIGQESAIREFKVTCMNGEVKDIEFRGTFLKDGRALITMSDITDRKRTEKMLEESQKIKARSKKMESLGLLAGGVAHDLNNILSGIVSYPDLLLLDLPENSKFRKPIETMQASGKRAAAVVQDLLTVARGVATTKEPLNLNIIISDYLNSPEFKKLKQFHPAVTVKTKLDSDLFNISGSEAHLRKIVMNLVSNAAEAIEGSGNIIISTINRYIDRSLRGYDDVNIGEYVILTVSDDGSGISSEDFERIFEPFYTKKVMGRSGTGLGLAVVWNVVQDHEGYIDMKSSDNGTTFELYFPITRDEISDESLSTPVKDLKGKGETILVIDDVKEQREIACSMLDALGYKTQAVAGGEEAVEYLKAHRVDLILLDMIMDPGINGRETYERIIKIHPDQKAVIASGFAETEDVKETQKMGAGQYLKKPLTLEKLGIAVREELDK